MVFSILRIGLSSVLLIVFCAVVDAQLQSRQITDQQLQIIKQQAVARINADRAEYRLPPVKLDDLASRVGDAHCKENVERGVISHWSTDGRKPYMRYSWAGGRDALAENLSQMTGQTRDDALWLSQELDRMQDGFMAEKPPMDGHRQVILMPQHTHVGIGIYWDGTRLCYAQEFLDRYVSVEALPTTARLRDNLTIKGKILSTADSLYLIDLLYEPFPKPMSLDELAATYAYNLPEDDEMTLRPKAPSDYVYADGKSGEITLVNNTFQTPMVFFKNAPGIYTIVVWVISQGKQIMATMISIKVTG